MIYILTGPSGAGKTTLGKELKKHRIPEVVSHTTRPMRVGEIDGVDYNFVTLSEFEKLEKIESSTYAGNHYCVSKSEIEDKLRGNFDVFIITDLPGAMKIREAYPTLVKIIYVSIEKDEMIERMKRRGDSEAEIEKRIKYTLEVNELHNHVYADHVINNSRDIEVSVQELMDIIHGKPYYFLAGEGDKESHFMRFESIEALVDMFDKYEGSIEAALADTMCVFSEKDYDTWWSEKREKE